MPKLAASVEVPSHDTDVRNTSPAETDTLVLIGIAFVVALVHVLTNQRYGFHRDELQFLSDARHLDWGFVPYPPFTPFVERISLSLFGLSLVRLRLFSVIAQGAAIIITGLMARELGGGRLAQITATLAIALSPLPLFEGTEFQYTTFDYLWWVLIAYFMIRLLKSDDPRWCLAIGAVLGLGFMTKYSIGFYLAGIVAGIVFTPARRFLATKWFWFGVGIAFAICLPNLIWQYQHDFISYTFLKHIHVRDVAQGRTNGFLRDQLIVCANTVTVLLWIPGLYFFLRDRRYRALAFMYVVPFLLFFFGKGRGYYLAGAYPMLVAMGAVAAERGLARLSRPLRWTAEFAFFLPLIAIGLYVCALVVPVASSGRLRDFALKNNGDLREEIGWPELVRQVAEIRDTLPPEEGQNVGIIVGNYGEQGAIEILGSAYHLPSPISGTNSAWYRSYPSTPPSALIVLGFSRKEADDTFTSCRIAGHNDSQGVRNEESKYHPDIFVCGQPHLPWPEFWKKFQRFG